MPVIENHTCWVSVPPAFYFSMLEYNASRFFNCRGKVHDARVVAKKKIALLHQKLQLQVK